MCDRSSALIPRLHLRRWTIPALAALLLATGPARAEKLTKEDRQWLRDVEVLILPQEEKIFHDLSAEDRPEFVRLFWARRNPNGPGAETNPARDKFEQELAAARDRFERYGEDNDCIQMLLLLGEPDRTGAMARPMNLGPATTGTQDTIVTQWIYHQIKGKNISKDFAIGFDEQCRMNETTRRSVTSSLQPKLASARVVNARVEIRLDEKKRLVPLARQLQQSGGPAQALLQSPRQDFPAANEVMFMRSGDGGTALLGVLEGRLEGAASAAPLKVTVRAETVSPQGKVVASTEGGASVHPAADGSFMVAYGLLSKPGTFTLRAGIIELGSQRGAAVSQAVDVPDYTVKSLTSSTLMFLETITPATDTVADDPLAPFVMGQYRLIPRVGRAFSKKETPLLVCDYYGGQPDAATGKPSVTGSLGLFKNGELLSRRVEQTLDVPAGVLVYGPLPLERYAPGSYEAEILITDASSKQQLKVRNSFEIKP